MILFRGEPAEPLQTALPVVFALTGLAGAVQNGGKTERTDGVVLKALLGELGGVRDAVEAVHREKFRISPNCETCASPCGNTSDYDMERFSAAPPEVQSLKRALINGLCRKARALRAAGVETLPEEVYQAISYLKYDLVPESYRTMLAKLEE